jgi:hypothetical protein
MKHETPPRPAGFVEPLALDRDTFRIARPVVPVNAFHESEADMR